MFSGPVALRGLITSRVLLTSAVVMLGGTFRGGGTSLMVEGGGLGHLAGRTSDRTSGSLCTTGFVVAETPAPPAPRVTGGAVTLNLLSICSRCPLYVGHQVPPGNYMHLICLCKHSPRCCFPLLI